MTVTLDRNAASYEKSSSSGKSSNEMFFTRKAITFVCLAVLISLHTMEATVADRYVLQYLTEAGYSMAASALQSETGLTSAATEGKALF